MLINPKAAETMENNEIITPKTSGKKVVTRVAKVLLWIVGIWAVILIALQVMLSSSVLTDLVNDLAEEYVDGDISFGRVEVSVFRNFPDVRLSLDDFSVTYPSDRFDDEEAAGPQGELLYHGTGETADTLASFQRLTASLNIASLAAGNLNIHHLRLTKPHTATETARPIGTCSDLLSQRKRKTRPAWRCCLRSP